MTGPRGYLRNLLEPSTIAVLGPSDRPGSGRQVIENLEQLGFPGTIVPAYPERRNRACEGPFPDAAQSRAWRGFVFSGPSFAVKMRLLSGARVWRGQVLPVWLG